MLGPATAYSSSGENHSMCGLQRTAVRFLIAVGVAAGISALVLPPAFAQQ